jgi:hypothetical protein
MLKLMDRHNKILMVSLVIVLACLLLSYFK